MSVELEFESSCSGTETGVAKNNSAHDINLVKSNFSTTLPDGTYVNLAFYASNMDNPVGAGDLVDWSATYRVTIEKL